jgi:hypothetical protein
MWAELLDRDTVLRGRDEIVVADNGILGWLRAGFSNTFTVEYGYRASLP